MRLTALLASSKISPRLPGSVGAASFACGSRHRGATEGRNFRTSQQGLRHKKTLSRWPPCCWLDFVVAGGGLGFAVAMGRLVAAFMGGRSGFWSRVRSLSFAPEDDSWWTFWDGIFLFFLLIALWWLFFLLFTLGLFFFIYVGFYFCRCLV